MCTFPIDNNDVLGSKFNIEILNEKNLLRNNHENNNNNIKKQATKIVDE